MKGRVSSIKIPCRIWLIAATLSTGLPAFSSGISANELPVSQASNQGGKVIEVTGTVSDSSGPVIGATVAIKNTSTGVITDLNGNFKLKIPQGATIVVSYIGYDNKEIRYNGERHLKISLEENIQQLDEVQVIAYGAQKKVTITGALSSIGTDELLKSPVASMANALTGKVTGLASVQSSGQPGADDAKLYVRGVGSLTEDLSQPLMLVDGVERSFFQLDPNEVENITVLKDASATAVFGVRGANGVILVTTKRGQEGKARINFSTTYAFQMPSRVPEFASSYEYAQAYNAAQIHDGTDPKNVSFSDEIVEAFRTNSNPILYPNTDWTDLLIKKSALQTQHNFNISGGSKRARYFASLGVFTQDGLFRTFDKDFDSSFKYNRYNYRVNMDIDVTKTTTMRVNLGGRLSDRRQPNYNNGTYTDLKYLFREIYNAVPFSGAGIVDGRWLKTNKETFKISNFQDGLNAYHGKGYNNDNDNMLNFDFVLEQKLDFLTKGLKVHAKGAYNSGVSTNKRREGRTAYYEVLADKTNSDELIYKMIQDETPLGYKETSGISRDWYLEAAFNYQRDFGVHHVSALAMYNQSMTYYPEGSFPGIPRSYVGLVGRVTYDYKTRYLLDASIGYNGSENFAPGKRFGTFPAGSIGWIASEEKFMAALKPFVSYLKFRASYGIVGNDRVSDKSRFLYLPDTYNIKTGEYNFGLNSSTLYYGSNEARKGNPNVTWETAAKQNYGVDLHFFDSRLKTSFDYFIEHRKNILKARTVNPFYLAVNLPIANIGKVDNKGYEVTVKWEDHVKDVRYYIEANLSYAKNKIVFQDEINYPYDWMKQTGKPVGQQFGYKNDGFFSQEDADNYANLKGQEGGIPDHGPGFAPQPGDVKYKDLNGDHKIDDKDRAAIGYPIYPMLTGGVNMGFSWKGFDLNMTWTGAFKTSRMLDSFYRVPFGDSNNYSIQKFMIEEAWTPEKGNSSKAPAISLTNSKGNNYQSSDLWLRDASYVRLKNIEIGYSLPRLLTQKMHVGSLRIFLSGYNLLTFDKLKVCDPESDPTTGTYPLIKVINVGLKVGF